MYIIDTHILLWLLYKPEKLSGSIREKLTEGSCVYISIVSLWEIAIKQSIGKLNIEESIETIEKACIDSHINILQIEAAHLDNIKSIPKIHNDPFDRLIIAQAKCENLTLITKDSNILKYDVIKTIN